MIQIIISMWIMLILVMVATGDCNEGNVLDASFANRIESCCRVDSRKEAHSDGARNLLQEAQSRFEVPTHKLVEKRMNHGFVRRKKF